MQSPRLDQHRGAEHQKESNQVHHRVGRSPDVGEAVHEQQRVAEPGLPVDVGSLAERAYDSNGGQPGLVVVGLLELPDRHLAEVEGLGPAGDLERGEDQRGKVEVNEGVPCHCRNYEFKYNLS